MSLPTNFFIGRGGNPLTSLTVLLMGGGGGSSQNFLGYGGPGGVAVFEILVPSGTGFEVTAGGDGDSTGKHGGGGGYSRIWSNTPGVNFNAVVGGGGGSGYMDVGGLGGGINQVGTAGFDTSESISNTNQINDENKNSGHGGSLTEGGIGGPSQGNADDGSAYNGGVYPYPGDSYPGGGGGAGYYGGGSGGGNNGQGGGPGGGGSGILQLGSVKLGVTHINSNHIGRSTLFQREGRAIWAQNFSGNWVHGNMIYSHMQSMAFSERTMSEFHHQLYNLSSIPTFQQEYFNGNGANENRFYAKPGKVRVIETETGSDLVNITGSSNGNTGNNTASVNGQQFSSFIAP